MQYKNIDIEEVNLAVFLKDKASANWRDNERYVLRWLNDNGIGGVSLENPIDDMVLLYLPNFNGSADINLLSEVYKQANQFFPEVKVSLMLEDFTEEGYNNIDLTLEEFISLQ